MSPTRNLGPPAAVAGLRPAISPVAFIVGAALVAATGIAWVWLLSSPMRSGGMASGMGPVRPWSAAYLLPASGMWAVMMVAMMTPSAAPMILLHARIDRRLSRAALLGQTLFFMLAYLLVWAAFSIAAAALQAEAVALGLVSAAALAVRAPILSASLLMAAAIYELTAAKRLCLNECQSPLLFLYRHYRPGIGGAFRTGIIHGLYCAGCCWMLMLLLFVGGVMNLVWVAILGVVIIGEKQAPPEWHARPLVAGLLAAAALTMLLWR